MTGAQSDLTRRGTDTPDHIVNTLKKVSEMLSLLHWDNSEVQILL